MRARFLSYLAGSLLGVAAAGFAGTTRITTWNLDLSGDAATGPVTNGASLQAAAAAMSKLDPDVILLQQVQDWQTCARLVQELKPANYKILVCSAFPRTTSGGKQAQLAILAKQKAFFSWSEPWQGEGVPVSGGFAFAAITAGGHRIGLFSVLFDKTMKAVSGDEKQWTSQEFNSAPARQWRAEIESLKNWVTNRIEAVLVAGAFNGAPGLAGLENKTSFALEDSKFIEAFLGAPLKSSITLSNGQSSAEAAKHGFVAQVVADPAALAGVILDQNGASCDLTVSPAAPAPAMATPATAAPAKAASATAAPSTAPARPSDTATLRPSSTNPPPVVAEAKSRGLRTPWLIGTLAGLIGGWIVVWLAKRSAAPRVPEPSSAGVPSAKTAPPPAAAVVLMARPSADSMEARTSTASPLSVMHVESPARTHTQSGSLSDEHSERAAAVMRTGLFALWSQWLKEKLMRRLIAERAELLGTQQEAAFKALAVEERLARVELQIQNQNRAYERRIEELTQELLAARDENRDLIRAQIAQVKAEMEAARTRALGQEKSDPVK